MKFGSQVVVSVGFINYFEKQFKVRSMGKVDLKHT